MKPRPSIQASSTTSKEDVLVNVGVKPLVVAPVVSFGELE